MYLFLNTFLTIVDFIEIQETFYIILFVVTNHS